MCSLSVLFFCLPIFSDAFSSPRLAVSSNIPPNNPAKSGCGHLEYRLVDHVDQLKQSVCPPHLFSLPAPGGNICLVVDEKEDYHAVRDRFPPLGLPVSRSGIVDTQVNVIEDMLFGTRFYLSDGTVRGRWCPGGTAGPVLRLTRFFQTMRIRMRRLRMKRYPSAQIGAHPALEVLTLKMQADCSLTVLLPAMASDDAGADETMKSRQRGLASEATPSSWVAGCGLAGYNH